MLSASTALPPQYTPNLNPAYVERLNEIGVCFPHCGAFNNFRNLSRCKSWLGVKLWFFAVNVAIDRRPSFAFDDDANPSHRQADTLGDRRHGFAGSMTGVNGANSLFVNLGLVILAPFPVGPAPFGFPVLRVVSSRPRKKVGGVYAQTVVTSVTNENLIRYRAVNFLKNKAGCAARSAGFFEGRSSVTVRINNASIMDAAVRPRYGLGKDGCEAVHHATLYSQNERLVN